jgi:hypothetical protein
VTRVPYIVLIKDDLLFEFKSYVTEETLATFVTGEKIVESGLPIPEQMGFVNFISIILKESVNVLNEQIEEFVQKNLNLNLKWKPSYTVILLILVLVFIIILEYYVVYFCCSIGSTPKKKVDNKTNSGQSVEKTEQTENKEEINKEENQNNKQKSD